MAKTTFILIDGDKTNTYGFRIDLSGLSLDRFNANPVMLYQHNSEVIGKWYNVRVEENKLKADADFDLEDETGKKVAGKVKRGYLNGASVGIIINEMIINDTERVAAKTELLEASIVSVPADAGALKLYDNSRKELSENEIQTLFINNLNEKKMAENNTIELTAQVTKLTADNAAKDTKIAKLEATIAELQTKERKAFLTAAKAEGKITEGEIAGLEKLAAQNFDAVKEVINARPAKAAASLAAQIAGKQESVQLDWDTLDKQDKLLKLKKEQPEVYAELYAKKFGK
ncbi:MAG: HK97 family phage prohead protease [Prevotellaceae bacterium]|jgi:HK97 family phage prohead protease|nr:HK97 family phage prohead protease [Prevotellaceae bacterium]